MRFTTAVGAAALLAGVVHADIAADAASAASAVESSVESVAADVEETFEFKTPEIPVFKKTNVTGDFVEQFTEGWDQRWKVSNAKKQTKNDEEEWAYVGQWAVEEPTVYKGMANDAGLVVKNKAAHHAISAKFPKPIDNTDNTLVVQYEVKLQNGLECGGAYLKLLRDTAELKTEEFSNESPYVIMFGPDKCGSTNKVHFIVNHKNPKTGEYEEKHMTKPPAARIVKTTELYTLIIKPDNSFIIQLNGQQVREGNLLEDFVPAFNPEAEIDDPEDTKPADWVDEARIPDPEATKPEDWDEDAPFEIVDESATQPEDWLVDEPLTIPDPEAEKPEDWDDEEDGDFVAPTVANPKCADVSGCGPWTKPLIKNPDYKGKWKAPYIDNPAYKGNWAPRKIANPDYYEDKTPANLEPMGAIGFEIWTMQNDILFDNIYIGHSIEDAKQIAEETFHEKHPIEQLLDVTDSSEHDKLKPASPNDLVFTEDPIRYITEKVELFVTLAKVNPIEAAKFVPEVAGGIAAIAIAFLGIFISILSGGSAPPAAKKAAAKAGEAKDKATSAAASGVEQGKEAVKRATRSAQ